MSFDTWVAKNDKSKEFEGKLLGSLPGVRNVLPVQFDPATNKTIELIDVLWLKGNSIVAAFEIESTTTIYSGLLRMADLIAMHPNLNILLYIVAPDKRREKVIEELNRPTFSRLHRSKAGEVVGQSGFVPEAVSENPDPTQKVPASCAGGGLFWPANR